MDDKMNVKALLKGDYIRKFRAIKQKLGLTHDAEVLRSCINSVYERMENPKKKEA